MIPDQEYFHVNDYICKKGSSHLYYRRRSIIIKLLEEIQLVFKLSINTLQLSINYFDRCMNSININDEDLELLATTCIYIASKFYECSEEAPTTKDFAYIASSEYQEVTIDQKHKKNTYKYS